MTFSEDEVSAIIGQLDEPRWNCVQGKINSAFRTKDGECQVCDGSGYTLAEAGAALLEFIRRHAQRTTQS